MSNSLRSADGRMEKQPPMEVFNTEEPGSPRTSSAPTDTEKVVHADGTVEYVDKHALGGDFDKMPEGYYTSPQFLGTLAAQSLASICAYLGWVLPANTLCVYSPLPVSSHLIC